MVRRSPPVRYIGGVVPPLFLRSSYTSDLRTHTLAATLPDFWGLGSVLGLVGPVSLSCGWVK